MICHFAVFCCDSDAREARDEEEGRRIKWWSTEWWLEP